MQKFGLRKQGSFRPLGSVSRSADGLINIGTGKHLLVRLQTLAFGLFQLFTLYSSNWNVETCMSSHLSPWDQFPSVLEPAATAMLMNCSWKGVKKRREEARRDVR